jgi:polysaccharide pyruvyl transferase WcaK-like protein
MEMDKIALCQHAGSGNHGCEAIVDSIARMLPEQNFLLMTNSRAEDEQYLPAEVKARVEIEEERHIADHKLTHALYYAYRLVTKDRESFLRYRFAPITGKDKPRLAVCIGGDNYCYDYMVSDLILTNSMLHRQGTKTVLIGCSVEPELLQRRDILEDMKSYEWITARESITYKALLDAGLSKERVILCPDPAFTLPVSEKNLPSGMASGNTVGINLSPLIEDYAADKSIALRSYEALIQHILDATDMGVALIPHVVWRRSDDYTPLRKLYWKFKDTGRVILTDDRPAEEMKGVIANCRFFIGARTHATIAAYSTVIPTLVVGYSVKARGIARDLFGTEEHYVLPVQDLRKPEQLIAAWTWLYEHEDEIRFRLAGAIPLAMSSARQNADVIRKAAVKS